MAVYGRFDCIVVFVVKSWIIVACCLFLFFFFFFNQVVHVTVNIDESPWKRIQQVNKSVHFVLM